MNNYDSNTCILKKLSEIGEFIQEKYQNHMKCYKEYTSVELFLINDSITQTIEKLLFDNNFNDYKLSHSFASDYLYIKLHLKDQSESISFSFYEPSYYEISTSSKNHDHLFSFSLEVRNENTFPRFYMKNYTQDTMYHHKFINHYSKNIINSIFMNQLKNELLDSLDLLSLEKDQPLTSTSNVEQIEHLFKAFIALTIDRKNKSNLTP